MEKLPPREGDEKELLVELSHYDPVRSRLSCQVEFTEQLDGLVLTIAPDE
jgi:2Fe-2S ferredoxin